MVISETVMSTDHKTQKENYSRRFTDIFFALKLSVSSGVVLLFFLLHLHEKFIIMIILIIIIIITLFQEDYVLGRIPV